MKARSRRGAAAAQRAPGSVRRYFATAIYRGRLYPRSDHGLNRRLLRECLQLRRDDVAGRRWSDNGYPGGYTSYASQPRMQQVSPTFAALERALRPHVVRFARALELELTAHPLAMTDCWVSIMPRGCAHPLHLHPHASISGTYYVRAPRGCSGLKFEDPRLDRFMAAPLLRAGSDGGQRGWVTLPAVVGELVLFESWLRHEVPVNRARGERISISFNYNWF
jgi:uncharacterized protein (TIGR02466 family)